MVKIKEKNTHLLKIILIVFLIITAFLVGFGSNKFFKKKKKTHQPKTFSSKDKYLAFIFEAYDTIQQNYWEKLTDEQLTNLFKLAIEKQTGQKEKAVKLSKKNLENFLKKTLKSQTSEQMKKEFSAKIVDIVLANLKPFGRSRLYSQKLEKQLKNNVQNINPNVDQYQVLNVEKNASQEEIEKKYLAQKKKWESKANQSQEAKQKYQQIKHAYEVLKDPEARKIYDTSGVEPTMSYQLLTPNIFYIHMTKVSPTSLDELQRITKKVDKGQELDSLILDLRDNVGGAIDLLPYFLGPFIGQDQYAYQFYHQGQKIDFKTKTGFMPSLVRYKKTVILINKNTQSSAELIAAVLKKYNVGILVGSPSKGWGTIERVFPLKNQLDEQEKYSLFLVHSLSLRDDNQPIEGKGVEPLINIKNQNWPQELYRYFSSEELVKAVKEKINLQ